MKNSTTPILSITSARLKTGKELILTKSLTQSNTILSTKFPNKPANKSIATRLGNNLFFHNQIKKPAATIENTITNRNGTGKDRAIPILK